MNNIVYIDSSNAITIKNLMNTATNAYINDATVTMVLVDSLDNNVIGEQWPITLDYVAGSRGVYTVVMNSDIQITRGDKYTAIVTITTNSGLKLTIRSILKANYHFS